MAGEQDTRPLSLATAVTAHISAPAFFPLTRERVSEKDEPETLVVRKNSPALKSVSAPVMADRGGLTQSGPPRARTQNVRAGLMT